MPLPTPTPVDLGVPAGIAGSSRASSPILYFRARLINSGTFTTGAGLDWSTQFTDSAEATLFLPVIGGELNTGAISTGVSADVAFYTTNPFDFSVWIEASAGAGTVQLYVNGAISELTAAAMVSISAIRGYNVIKISRATGPLVLIGRFLSQMGESRWQSLYAVGSDPILATSGSGGLGSHGNSTPDH